MHKPLQRAYPRMLIAAGAQSSDLEERSRCVATMAAADAATNLVAGTRLWFELQAKLGVERTLGRSHVTAKWERAVSLTRGQGPSDEGSQSGSAHPIKSILLVTLVKNGSRSQSEIVRTHVSP